MPTYTTRLLEIANRFDELAVSQRDNDLRRQYGKMATLLRQLASERILGLNERGARLDLIEIKPPLPVASSIGLVSPQQLRPPQ